MKRLLLTLFILSLDGYSAGENDCGSLEKCDSFNTKEDAVIALRSIRDNENKYAWILTISNQ